MSPVTIDRPLGCLGAPPTPKEPEMRRLRYGWQTLIADLGAMSLFLAAADNSTTVLGYTTHVFWRDASNQLKHATQVTTPDVLCDQLTSSPAAAAVGGESRIDVVARRSGSSNLQHRVWEESVQVALFPQEQSKWCWAAQVQMITHYYRGLYFQQCDYVNYVLGRTD